MTQDDFIASLWQDIRFPVYEKPMLFLLRMAYTAGHEEGVSKLKRIVPFKQRPVECTLPNGEIIIYGSQRRAAIENNLSYGLVRKYCKKLLIDNTGKKWNFI